MSAVHKTAEKALWNWEWLEEWDWDSSNTAVRTAIYDQTNVNTDQHVTACFLVEYTNPYTDLQHEEIGDSDWRHVDIGAPFRFFVEQNDQVENIPHCA